MSDILVDDDYQFSLEERIENAVKTVYPFATSTSPSTWKNGTEGDMAARVDALNLKLPPSKEAKVVGRGAGVIEIQVQERTIVEPHTIRALILGALTLISVFFTMSWGGPQELWAGDLRAAAIGAAGIVGVLFAHEMGHYIALRRWQIHGSYPHLIPLPIWWGGTLGGFVMCETPPHRRASLELAAGGPIAGLLVAVPCAIIGIMLSSRGDLPFRTTIFENGGFLWNGLVAWLGPAGSGYLLLHPLAVVGYWGIFITGLNLLPAFPLDGGRWVLSVLPPMLRQPFAVVAIVALIVTSVVAGGSNFFLIGLAAGAVRHLKQGIATDDVTPLHAPYLFLGLLVWFALLVLLYDPTPFEQVPYQFPLS